MELIADVYHLFQETLTPLTKASQKYCYMVVMETETVSFRGYTVIYFCPVFVTVVKTKTLSWAWWKCRLILLCELDQYLDKPFLYSNFLQ